MHFVWYILKISDSDITAYVANIAKRKTDSNSIVTMTNLGG